MLCKDTDCPTPLCSTLYILNLVYNLPACCLSPSVPFWSLALLAQGFTTLNSRTALHIWQLFCFFFIVFFFSLKIFYSPVDVYATNHLLVGGRGQLFLWLSIEFQYMERATSTTYTKTRNFPIVVLHSSCMISVFCFSVEFGPPAAVSGITSDAAICILISRSSYAVTSSSAVEWDE